MAFFVSVPVSLSGLFGNNTAWNDRNSALFLQPTYKLIAVIFLIASMSLPFKSKGSNIACAIQILFRFPLESKKRNGFPSPSVTAMDFRGQAPSAPSGFLVVSPFLTPLACWWTLIVVLSSISVVSSTKSCSIRAVRISSHTPAFVQARNRLYTLCHGPNRSGRSLHGIPVFSQYRIALSISRLLFPGWPPCSFFSGGNLFLIRFHCFFAYFMCFILSSYHFTHNI